MRPLLALVVWFACCSCLASDAARAPTGEEVFDLIFKNSNVSLRTEPLCNLKSTTRPGQLTLGGHLATVLATSYGTRNTVNLKSECVASKYEAPDGSAKDGWECRIEMLETKKSEFISSASIAFAVSLDRTKLIPGSLRCT